MHLPRFDTISAGPAWVNVHYGGTAAELPCHGGHQFRRPDGGRVNAYFLRAGLNQTRRIVKRADAAPHGERHKDLFRHPSHYIEHNRPAFVTGANIEEDELIGSFLLI